MTENEETLSDDNPELGTIEDEIGQVLGDNTFVDEEKEEEEETVIPKSEDKPEEPEDEEEENEPEEKEFVPVDGDVFADTFIDEADIESHPHLSPFLKKPLASLVDAYGEARQLISTTTEKSKRYEQQVAQYETDKRQLNAKIQELEQTSTVDLSKISLDDFNIDVDELPDPVTDPREFKKELKSKIKEFLGKQKPEKAPEVKKEINNNSVLTENDTYVRDKVSRDMPQGVTIEEAIKVFVSRNKLIATQQDWDDLIINKRQMVVDQVLNAADDIASYRRKNARKAKSSEKVDEAIKVTKKLNAKTKKVEEESRTTSKRKTSKKLSGEEEIFAEILADMDGG